MSIDRGWWSPNGLYIYMCVSGRAQSSSVSDCFDPHQSSSIIVNNHQQSSSCVVMCGHVSSCVAMHLHLPRCSPHGVFQIEFELWGIPKCQWQRWEKGRAGLHSYKFLWLRDRKKGTRDPSYTNMNWIQSPNMVFHMVLYMVNIP